MFNTRNLSRSPFAARRPHDVAIVLCALGLIGCGAPSATAPAPAPPTEPARVTYDGTFEELSGVRTTLVRSASPFEGVATAADAAAHACDHSGGGGDSPESGDAADPFFAAWLRVEAAATVARVVIAPSPPSAPVSIERQTLAREHREVGPGELHLYAVNTRERYEVRLYDNDGRMRPEAILEIAQAMRDQRADIARSPEPRLLQMLYLIGQHFDAEIEIVSGYRVRNVNATEGSRHGAAAACDIRIEGVGIREIARFAETTFARTGVGYYPNSGFVHVDARSQSYFWVDYSRANQRSRTRSRSVDVVARPEDDITLRSVHITEEELYQLPPEWQSYGYEAP